MSDVYYNNLEADLEVGKNLPDVEKQEWRNEIPMVPKHPTYSTFKENYDKEPSVCKVYNRDHC